MRIDNILPSHMLQNRAIRVLLVGAGGTGSAVAMGLPYLDQAMHVWGHRFGLTVALMVRPKL
jgi:shikimate 5-dehydrogenase